MISFSSYGEEVGSESYDWKKWDCYDFIDGGYILSVGYIPEIGDSKGILFVKDVDSHIDTFHFLRDVQHFWEWGSYTIVIESNGTGRFHNNGILEERYECTSAPLEKLMYDIW
tara:strand:- start:83 stop:421 length:339 start_codon:yes stop_codon:yes gene_type:complete